MGAKPWEIEAAAEVVAWTEQASDVDRSQLLEVIRLLRDDPMSVGFQVDRSPLGRWIGVGVGWRLRYAVGTPIRIVRLQRMESFDPGLG